MLCFIAGKISAPFDTNIGLEWAGSGVQSVKAWKLVQVGRYLGRYAYLGLTRYAIELYLSEWLKSTHSDDK